MNETDDDRYIRAVSRAAGANDLTEVERLLASRRDVNATDSYGEPLMEEVLGALSDRDEHRYDVVRLLLDRGVDPTPLAVERKPVLMTPVWWMDARMVGILVDAGVDPNRGSGFDEFETFYSYAKWDYAYKTGLSSHPHPPERSDDEAEDLARLDRWAVAFGKVRPEHLKILRSAGALTSPEMAVRIGGSPDDRIRWSDEWRLDQLGGTEKGATRVATWERCGG